MAIISKTHQRFSERLENPRVLTNPEEFLGPNYETILNFWLILDDLTEELLKVIEGRYLDFYDNQYSEWDKTTDEALKASKETIGSEFAGNAGNAADAAWDGYGPAALWATRELIGMHKLFEQNKPLTFFPMFLEVL